MENPRAVTVDLPEELLLALGRAAASAGCTPSAYVRAVLLAALARSPARLRGVEHAVSLAIHLAPDWLELQRRLRALGYVLRLTPEGGLHVHSWPLDHPILPLDQLGHRAEDLTLRFRAPFPGALGPVPARARPMPLRPPSAA